MRKFLTIFKSRSVFFHLKPTWTNQKTFARFCFRRLSTTAKMADPGSEKLARIRHLMSSNKYDMYVVTIDDRHNSEYVHDRDKLIQYLTNFSGSYGVALVSQTEARIWTDGRYHTQATSELYKDWILMREGETGVPSVREWLHSNAKKGQIVATDPYLMSNAEWNRIKLKISPIGATLVGAPKNLVYEIWDDRPESSRNEIFAHPIKFSGMTAGKKVAACREKMKQNGSSILVFTSLCEVAYLMNLRGSDIPYNPVFYSYVILEMDAVHFFVDRSRLSAGAVEQLKKEEVEVTYHPYEDVVPVLKQLVSKNPQTIVWLSNSSSAVFHLECAERTVVTGVTPVCLMMVVKNQVEAEGMKLAHIKDAVALVKYFAWLQDKIQKREFVTEISGATRLEEFRKEQENFDQLSFPTISSVGEHAAVIHYIPKPSTDRQITDKEVYLCDSGGQYYEGTTDVTRTLHFGEPTAYEKECFTRVFKGQAKLSRSTFPRMIVGNYLDTLARISLWEVGLNYLHGTGHGVGSYLNVHEYPVMISWKEYPDDPGMQANVFVSNEPGYYESGKFGIRLENIEQVVDAQTKYQFKKQTFLKFETATLVPIQTKMLDMSLLSDDEIEYLNAYHARCLNTLSPWLQKPEDLQALTWLQKETLPIHK